MSGGNHDFGFLLAIPQKKKKTSTDFLTRTLIMDPKCSVFLLEMWLVKDVSAVFFSLHFRGPANEGC